MVLGVGNLLNSDEGLGVHAVRELALCVEPDPVLELVDGGVLGLDLLPLVESSSHLLVLDAVDAGRPPGELVELAAEDIPLLAGLKLSQHQVTFQEVLGLAAVRGRLPPHLRLLGAQPADLSLGVGLSPVLRAAVPDLVSRALVVLRQWGLPATRLASTAPGRTRGP